LLISQDTQEFYAAYQDKMTNHERLLKAKFSVRSVMKYDQGISNVIPIILVIAYYGREHDYCRGVTVEIVSLVPSFPPTKLHGC
jgi:hypothetical protein